MAPRLRPRPSQADPMASNASSSATAASSAPFRSRPGVAATASTVAPGQVARTKGPPAFSARRRSPAA